MLRNDVNEQQQEAENFEIWVSLYWDVTQFKYRWINRKSNFNGYFNSGKYFLHTLSECRDITMDLSTSL
jgi:hypothetical protein